jgi:hypothetical protein
VVRRIAPSETPFWTNRTRAGLLERAIPVRQMRGDVMRGLQNSVEQLQEGPLCVVRGWMGEFLQGRRLEEGDYRLWHSDGAYYGRLTPDELHGDESASGTVFGPTGIYLADATDGRLHVDTRRRRARATAEGFDPGDFESPGSLEPVERRWHRPHSPH